MSDYIHTKDGREIPASQYIRELHAEQATWKGRAERYLRDMGLGFKRVQELEEENIRLVSSWDVVKRWAETWEMFPHTALSGLAKRITELEEERDILTKQREEYLARVQSWEEDYRQRVLHSGAGSKSEVLRLAKGLRKRLEQERARHPEPGWTSGAWIDALCAAVDAMQKSEEVVE